MERNIHITNVENSPAVCFDTGLDPRSFARTKMSQCLIEQGFAVKPDGTRQIWKAAGVKEINGLMRVWGPMFSGKRLDIILEEIDSPAPGSGETNALYQNALQAVVYWIRAKMLMGETRTAINPGASFIHPKGGVFFAPEHLSNRCLFIEGSKLDRYNCPDLIGMDTTAFCAGIMLYKIFSGFHPYPSADIYQDMREGIFMPVHLAAPSLDKKLSELIHSALILPVVSKKTTKSGTDILSEMLEILMGKEGKITSISDLFCEIPAEKTTQVEKEKKRYQIKQSSFVKTRRFLVRNKYLVIGVAVGLLFILFAVISTARSIMLRPTTEGLTSFQVIEAYYNAFSSLDHVFMEACTQGSAGKRDINAAATYLAIVKQREAYEMTIEPIFYPASEWLEKGGELPSPRAFGVTDLIIKLIGGNEDAENVAYNADYNLWTPTEEYVIIRSDRLMLKRDRRGNWRIIEIMRTENIGLN
ncbi:MAG: hypothetical protein FWD13_04540 [Treponema sp.]|nr:hypothetical protein [Treponema sp.]